MTIILILGTATPAYAYLDPGTGGMLLSMIVGLVATAWFAFKGFFYKIKNFFKKGDLENEDSSNNRDQSDIRD